MCLYVCAVVCVRGRECVCTCARMGVGNQQYVLTERNKKHGGYCSELCTQQTWRLLQQTVYTVPCIPLCTRYRVFCTLHAYVHSRLVHSHTLSSRALSSRCMHACTLVACVRALSSRCMRACTLAACVSSGALSSGVLALYL